MIHDEGAPRFTGTLKETECADSSISTVNRLTTCEARAAFTVVPLAAFSVLPSFLGHASCQYM